MKKIHDHEMLHTQTRYLELMERDRQVLIQTFAKYVRRESERQRLGHRRLLMGRLGLKMPVLLLLLLFPAPAWALGPILGPGCVANWSAVTTAGGLPITTGTVSYKLLVATTAATGGPVLPPPGATVITAAGISAPMCASLVPGQQYSVWGVPTVTPPIGAPVDGDPTAANPFQMATTAQKPDAMTNFTLKP